MYLSRFSPMRWLKYALLILSIGSAGVALALLAHERPIVSPDAGVRDTKPGSTVQAKGFHYTEIRAGMPVYKLSGDEIHDEHARIGPLRVSILNVVRIARPRVELLPENPGGGWVLHAEEGHILAGQKKLILRGKVRGERKDGATLFANRAIFNVATGHLELKDGYALNTPRRRERGVRTTL